MQRRESPLYLVWELVFHVLLDSAQHERLEDHVQPGKLIWKTISRVQRQNASHATVSTNQTSASARKLKKQNEVGGKKCEKAAEGNASVALTLVDGRLVFGVALDVLGEPLVELFMGIKQRRHDEVQQGPQLRDSNNTQLLTALICTYTFENTHTHTHTHTHTALTSAIVFWMGVPVSRSLFRHWNCRRIFHRTLNKGTKWDCDLI